MEPRGFEISWGKAIIIVLAIIGLLALFGWALAGIHIIVIVLVIPHCILRLFDRQGFIDIVFDARTRRLKHFRLNWRWRDITTRIGR